MHTPTGLCAWPLPASTHTDTTTHSPTHCLPPHRHPPWSTTRSNSPHTEAADCPDSPDGQHGRLRRSPPRRSRSSGSTRPAAPACMEAFAAIRLGTTPPHEAARDKDGRQSAGQARCPASPFPMQPIEGGEGRKTASAVRAGRSRAGGNSSATVFLQPATIDETTEQRRRRRHVGTDA